MINFEAKFIENGITSAKSMTHILTYVTVNSYFFLLNVLCQKGFLNEDDLKNISDNMEENFNTAVNINAKAHNEAYSRVKSVIKEMYSDLDLSDKENDAIINAVLNYEKI